MSGRSSKGLHSILKKDADIFVALSHLGVDADKKFAKDNPFLDVIIGGHSHTVLTEPIVEKKKDGTPAGAIIVQTGSRGLYLGRLDLVVEGRRDPKTKKEDHWVKSYKHQLIPITSDLPEDPQMVELLEGYKKQLKTKPLEEVLATVSGDLTRSDQGDSLLGSIATDALAKAAGAEIALLNSGSFRSQFRSGPLTREILYEIYPFDDEVIVLDVPGSYLRKAIEASESKRGQGGFLQVSGLRIEKADGQLRILFGNELLNDRRKYLVAVNDFLAQGGDGYNVFRRIKSRRKTQIMIRDLLEETLKAKQKISSGDFERRWYSR